MPFILKIAIIVIDFIKINNLGIGLSTQELLDFEYRVIKKTGEILTQKKKSAYLKNLIFTLTPEQKIDKHGRIIDLTPIAKLMGSIHVYANGGKFNNDRFTFIRFLTIQNELKKFISPDDRINVLEFALNVITPFDPTDFINNLMTHLKTPFNKTITQDEVSSYVKYSHFVLKIYNKGIQQPTGSFILRIEVKYLKMQRLFPRGLKWADLSKIEIWNKLGDEILKKITEVIYYDPSIDLEKVPEKDREILIKGHNPIYWQNQKGPHLSRDRHHYQDLVRKNGVLFNLLPQLLNQELSRVVNYSHFPDLNIAVKDSLINKELVNCSRFAISDDSHTHSTENRALVNCSPLLYSNNSPCTTSNSSAGAFCKVTGIDISCQKSGSKFLGISGLRQLYNLDPSSFERLKSGRLSPKWEKSSLEIQFREISHSIRNQTYNTNRDIKKLYKDPVLFDFWLLIKEEKRIIQ